MPKCFTFLDKNISLENELKNDKTMKPVYLNTKKVKGYTELYLSNTNKNGLLCAITNETHNDLLDCFRQKEKKIENIKDEQPKKKTEKKSVQGNLSGFFIKK